MPAQLRLILIVLCSCISYLSFAQQDTARQDMSHAISRHNLSASIGFLTTDYIFDGYRPGRPSTFAYANKAESRVLCVSYQYRCSSRCAFGFTGTFEQQSGDWLENYVQYGKQANVQANVKGAFVRTCFTTGADFVYEYASRGILTVYLTAGIGATYELETTRYDTGFYYRGYENGINRYGPARRSIVNAHLNGFFSPVGIRLGNRLAWFGELGFGYKGVFNTGLSYRFNQKTPAK